MPFVKGDMVELKACDYVRFAVADIHGRSSGSLVPVRHAQKYLKRGVNLLCRQGEPEEPAVGPVVALPCEDTFHEVPWSGDDKFRVVEVICESYWLKDGSLQRACPRYIARCQLDKLRESGYELLSGFEIEYLLQNKNEIVATGTCNTSHRPHAKLDAFLFYMEHQMFHAGVDIECMHAEYDVGVFETITRATHDIRSPDMAFIFKTGLLEIADIQDYIVSLSDNVSMNFHHSLVSVDGGTNVFANMSNPDDLSDLARHWIAGLLKHAKALTALYCPTVKCYENLLRRHNQISWSFNEKSAVVRARLYRSDKGPYLENRVPSGMSNPYLTLAASVAAGLDGVVNKLECPSQVDKEDDLHRSLSEALEELQKDVVIVDSLGQEFVDRFVTVVRRDLNAHGDTVESGCKENARVSHNDKPASSKLKNAAVLEPRDSEIKDQDLVPQNTHESICV